MNELNFTLHKELDTDRKSVSMIEQFIFPLKSRLNISNGLYYNILVALTEAVNNAIIHGNRLNPEKKVIIDLSVYSGTLEIDVCDEGEGFEPMKLSDPRDPENLLKVNGRGVFLIKELTSFCNIESNNHGTKVMMKFVLSS